MEIEMVDLVGLYQLTGADLPDLLVHVFRARSLGGEATVNAPGRICRLSWHDPVGLPQPMTATTRTAVADAVAGRSGVLAHVQRDVEPEIPDASDAYDPAIPLQSGAVLLAAG
jgi:8-oxo-dGTP diphosphatase